MIWRTMTFTMMEKDQDMAKVTLEEEVKRRKKSKVVSTKMFRKTRMGRLR